MNDLIRLAREETIIMCRKHIKTMLAAITALEGETNQYDLLVALIEAGINPIRAAKAAGGIEIFKVSVRATLDSNAYSLEQRIEKLKKQIVEGERD